MIYLYTKIQNADNWILKNDLYFNLYTSNQPLSEADRRAILQIDGATVTKDGHIETKYGIGTVRNLSSGCKTYLNIIKNPDKVVSIKECGRNVLTMIFRLEGIHVYADYPECFDIGENVTVTVNDQDIIVGKKGYESWWHKEYKRRAEDDL